MSKTFRIRTVLNTKLVLDDATLAGIRGYIATRKLPAAFQEYLDRLDDEAMLRAFIAHQTREWFKGELERDRIRNAADGATMTYAPVQVTVEGKTK